MNYYSFTLPFSYFSLFELTCVHPVSPLWRTPRLEPSLNPNHNVTGGVPPQSRYYRWEGRISSEVLLCSWSSQTIRLDPCGVSPTATNVLYSFTVVVVTNFPNCRYCQSHCRIQHSDIHIRAGQIRDEGRREGRKVSKEGSKKERAGRRRGFVCCEGGAPFT